MKDKVVFITGASGGLGASVTQAFLSAGARVIGSARKISTSDFPRPNFDALPVDFTKKDDVQRAVSRILERYGRLDILVHVVGAFAGGQPVSEIPDATWEQMLQLNLNAAFHVFRETIPALRKSGCGRLVVIGSLAAAQPQRNLAAYVVSKAALAMLVQTVAIENADSGMTANIILPGTMDTPANRAAMPTSDFSKWLKTSDVAQLALTLAADNAAHLNGLAIPIEARHA